MPKIFIGSVAGRSGWYNSTWFEKLPQAETQEMCCLRREKLNKHRMVKKEIHFRIIFSSLCNFLRSFGFDDSSALLVPKSCWFSICVRFGVKEKKNHWILRFLSQKRFLSVLLSLSLSLSLTHTDTLMREYAEWVPTHTHFCTHPHARTLAHLHTKPSVSFLAPFPSIGFLFLPFEYPKC